MNTGKRKLLKTCQASLISLAILFSLVGCNVKTVDTIDSDRDTIVSYNMQNGYGYAVGMSYIYILYGKYQKLPGGVAIAYKDKSLHTYRIRDLITKYPILDTPASKKAALEQEKKLKLI